MYRAKRKNYRNKSRNYNRAKVHAGEYKSGDMFAGREIKCLGRAWNEEGEEVQYVYFTEQSSAPKINYTTFGSGNTIYQNARGRCEDAPCCGCCS